MKKEQETINIEKVDSKKSATPKNSNDEIIK